MSDDRRQHRIALTLKSAGQMLPVEQKPHEILQRHGLDFPPQTLDRVAVNPREQVPFAPLFFGAARGESASQHVAFALQLRQGLVDLNRR
ncbi:hypothetical protein D3C87_1287650 [compost metagenome]